MDISMGYLPCGSVNFSFYSSTFLNIFNLTLTMSVPNGTAKGGAQHSENMPTVIGINFGNSFASIAVISKALPRVELKNN